MNIDFRDKARKTVARAKVELASGQDDRLKYAALELRMCIEAITYDRLQAYKSEINPKGYEVWQPKKVMQLLLEIDPSADKDVSIWIGLEESPGIEAKEMKPMGTDTALDLKTIKKHYDALGSYLHMPTLKQLQQAPSIDFKKLRDRCEKITTALEAILSSPIFNCTVGGFTNIECSRCKAPVRKRIQHGVKELEAKCLECNAGYSIKEVGAGEHIWTPKTAEIHCPTKGCTEVQLAWEDELNGGTRWCCSKCKEKYVFQVGMMKDM